MRKFVIGFLASLALLLGFSPAAQAATADSSSGSYVYVNGQSYSCSQLLFGTPEPLPCTDPNTAMFYEQFATGFEPLYNSYELQYLRDSFAPYSQRVAVNTVSYMGFMACLRQISGYSFEAYASEIRGVGNGYQMATNDVLRPVWTAAPRYLCPQEFTSSMST